MNRIRIVLIGIIISLSLTTAWLGYVVATPAPSRASVIEPGSMSNLCTDYIFVDGTTPVDRTGFTGQNTVGSAGQDPGTFINNQMASNKQFCLEAGITFTSSVTVNTQQNVNFIGGGMFTTVWTYTGTGAAFNNTGNNLVAWKSFQISLTGVGGTAIWLQSLSFFNKIEDMALTEPAKGTSNGIVVTGGPGSTCGPQDTYIAFNRIAHLGTGILSETWPGSGGGTCGPTAGHIVGNSIQDTNQAIDMESDKESEFSANGLWDFTTYGVICNGDRETFSSTDFESATGGTRPFNVKASCSNLVSNSGTCNTPACGPSVAGTGRYFIRDQISIFSNVEAMGTATISASTTVVVSHGMQCSGTPAQIQVSPQSTGYGTFAITSPGSTSFTITVTTSGTYTFYWHAWC